MTTKLDDFLTQSGLEGSKLAHFGRKGMKWGIRRSDDQLASTRKRRDPDFHRGEIVKLKTMKTEIAAGRLPSKTETPDSVRISRIDQHIKDHETALGESPDAVRAHATLSTIRAKGSLTAVSDADLSHLVNRINLEKRFSEVDPSTFDKGHAKLQKALKVGTTMNDVIKFINSPAGNLAASSFGLSKHGKHAKPPKVGKKKK